MKRIIAVQLLLLSCCLLLSACFSNIKKPVPNKPPLNDNLGGGIKPAIETRVMKVNAKKLKLYIGADETSDILRTLSRDDRINVIINGDNTTFYPVINNISDIIGYVQKDYVVDENAVLYAVVPYTSSILKNRDGTTPTSDNLIDVREYSKDLVIYMVLAHDDNFCGRALYERDLCLLQKETLDKLLTAQKKFREDGYGIKIYDAYRPLHVQDAMYKIVSDPRYIADPKKASDHVRGAAVDMTLVDSYGNELEMPSPVHTFNKSSCIFSKNMTETARGNMKYMQKIMLECGFLLYSEEWWHFRDSDYEQYNVTDHHFDDIEMAVR